jgi:hypothetical protein
MVVRRHIGLSLLIGIIIAGGITPRVLQADTFYVDKNHASASDSNPGNLSLPWETILYAAETITAGDTVYIRAGTYDEPVYFKNSGNNTSGYILMSGYPGETPIIDGTVITHTGTGIVIDKDYIKISDLEIRNWSNTGIWIEGAGFTVINDCVIHDVMFGVGLADGAHDFTFNRVEVHHFSLYGFDASPTGGTDCFNGVWNHCISHTGRDNQQNVDGFALGHGTQHHFEFNHCITYDVYDGFDISSQNTTLNGCLAYDCWNGCYKLWQDQVKLVNCIGYDGHISVVEIDWDGTQGTTVLQNCTFYHGQTYTIWVENPGDSLSMINCVVAGGDNIGLAFEQMGVTRYHGDYNLFHNENPDRAIAVGYTDEFSLTQTDAGAWAAYSGQDVNSLVSTSASDIFQLPADFNLHLLPASPAVDKGTDAGAPTVDYDGNPRPSGNGFDMGAYEYQHGTDVENGQRKSRDPRSAELYPAYPNPFNQSVVLGFYLPEAVTVSMTIHDIRGREIEKLIHTPMGPGIHHVTWNAENIPSGVYLCCLRAGEVLQNNRIVLQK